MASGFFDVRKEVTARRPRASATIAEGADAGALSVSQLTRQIDAALRVGFPHPVLVRGEASNVKVHSGSGHIYFTLKDAESCIDCVMWKSDAERLRFDVEDGQELLASGSVKVYASRGKYQLYVTTLRPLGRGALEIAFQQLKAKLEAEGLFAADRKRPIPSYPRHIVIVTSRATAALQDMLKVLRHFPTVRLSLYHVPVQGDGCGARIADALRHLCSFCAAPQSDVDLILLGRGGGSLEDLWGFNEEAVARAIVAATIPIISGIGHEVDVSIADLVADYHAHTPTEAAQIAVQHWRGAGRLVFDLGARARRAMRSRFDDASHRLRAIERHELFRRPTDRINVLRQRLDDAQRQLSLAISERMRRASHRVSRAEGLLGASHPRNAIALLRERIEVHKRRLNRGTISDLRRRSLAIDAMDKHLRAIGPEQVLGRGYSITTVKRTGEIVRDGSQVARGDKIVTRLAEGTIDSVVQDDRQLDLF